MARRYRGSLDASLGGTGKQLKMGPHAWLFAFLLCCLSASQLCSAQLVVTAPAAAPGPSSVAPPAALMGGALSLPNVQQLTPGVLTTVQNVTFSKIKFYYFRLPNATVDISVQLFQYQGDADLIIIEPQNPSPFSNNGFEQNGWASTTAQNESIFIPRSDPFYSTGAYAVGIQGYAKGVSEYQLLVTFTSQKRVLIPDHKAALQTMLTECCGNATADACGNWVGQVVDETGEIATELCEVPGWICTVDGQLQVADFTAVGLTCPFPWSTLGALTSLTDLRLGNNSLTGTVDWLQLAKLPNLQVLTLDLNQFTGSVTCDLATPGTPLLEFNVATNEFNGSLPACYVQKPEMRTLWFNNNGFSGALPSTIPANSELRGLHVANAGVTGNLTADFGLLTNLQTLELSQNYITGTIPDGIVGPRLDALLLNNNRLTGPIPTSLTTAPQMRTLFLNNNQLTGSIADFANAPVLQQIFLEVNNLTGPFPQTWNTPKLISLEVSNNFLSGGIPLSLLTLPNLFAFAAANNLLSGALPDLGGAKSAVRIFNVTSNQLTGPIPTSYAALPVFDTRSAKLDPNTGNILAQIFDASYNILTGTVPSFFASTRLPAWTFVDLAGNELTCNGTNTKIANVACGVPAGVSTGGSAGPYASKGPASSTGAPIATPVPGVVSINPVVNTPSPSAAAAAALAGGTTSSSAVPVVNNNDGGSGGLSTGAIVGIVVGILVGVIALVALAVFAAARVTRRRREAVSAKSFKRFASMDAEPV